MSALRKPKSPAAPGFQPTSEQRDILQAVADLGPGQLLKIQARAGTGKTSTLELLAWADPRPMLYLAYNADIKKAAEKRFPETVTCKTTHGLAYSALDISRWIPSKGAPRNLRAWEVERWLNARRWHPGLKTNASQSDIAADVLATLRAFLHSDGERLEGLRYARCGQFKTRRQAFTDAAREENPNDPALSEREATAGFDRYRSWLIEKSEALWRAMIDPNNAGIPLEHDAYLKLYQLQRPALDYPLILLDEAQDTNPCVMALFLDQPAAKIMVGDEAQAIYGFRGARDALKAPGVERPLLQSFRFGERIADVANTILSFKPSYHAGFHRLRGTETLDSQVGQVAEPPYTVICRSNQGVFMAALHAAQRGLRINSGAKNLEDAIHYVESAWSLLVKSPLGKLHPEIAGFGSWDVLEQESTSDAALKWLVKWVTAYRESMPDMCQRLRDAKGARKSTSDVLVVTAHKSKGLEFDRVVLSDDFAALDAALEKVLNAPFAEQLDLIADLPEQELHLLYVAATRAKHQLQLNQTFDLMKKLDDVISRIRAAHGESPWDTDSSAPTSASEIPSPDLNESRAAFAALSPELQSAMKRAARAEGWNEAQWADETGLVSEIIRNGDCAPEVIRIATGIYDSIGAPR